MQEGHKSKLSLHSSGYDKSYEKINVLLKKFKNLVINQIYNQLFLMNIINNVYFSRRQKSKESHYMRRLSLTRP
jgi:hypothetical protein